MMAGGCPQSPTPGCDPSGLDSFWQHLDVLRSVLLRIAVVVVLASCVAFCFKEQLFNVIFAARQPEFVSYRVLLALQNFATNGAGVCDPMPQCRLINTGLSQQFVFHFKAAMLAGVVASAPFAIFQLFRFVAPGLYDSERRVVARAAVFGSLMFLLGVLVCYFVVFPLTYRFLAGYSVSQQIENMITLESYADTFLLLCLLMGLVFEIPLVSWLLGRLGLLSRGTMRQYRRHAVVAIVVVAAVITPTTDVFTLVVVSLPMWLLFEASIWLVRP